MNTRNDILAELQELSLVLQGIKSAEKKPQVPAGYFGQLSEVILAQINEEPQLRIFSSLSKDQSLGVPAQYFDDLSDRVMNKIHSQEAEIGRGKIIPIKNNERIIFLKRFAFAASFAGVILLGIKLFNNDQLPVDDCSETLACLTQDEIREYVNANIDEFEPEQIQEAFQSSLERQELENTPVPSEEAGTQLINEEQIEQYINENPATIDFEEESTDIF